MQTKSLQTNSSSVEVRLVNGLDGYYMCKPMDWSKEISAALAKQDNLILEEIHWCVIYEYRKYDKEYQCIPNNKELKCRIVTNCQITYEKFMELFPKGRHQAARISGVSLPTGYGYEL